MNIRSMHVKSNNRTKNNLTSKTVASTMVLAGLMTPRPTEGLVGDFTTLTEAGMEFMDGDFNIKKGKLKPLVLKLMLYIPRGRYRSVLRVRSLLVLIGAKASLFNPRYYSYGHYDMEFSKLKKCRNKLYKRLCEPEVLGCGTARHQCVELFN